MLTEADADELRASCTRFLGGHGPVRAAELLATIPPDTVVDRYGDGGVVAELEAEVAGLLGKPAAVFLPSGMMAQQAVLRVHADRRGRRTVLYHPMCHLAQHEGRRARAAAAPARPAGRRARTGCSTPRRPRGRGRAARRAAARAAAARHRRRSCPTGTTWSRRSAWARDRGAAVHLDGARLWEASAGYGRPPAEIAALFDTVYVSFYKGIGALAGCCVAGDDGRDRRGARVAAAAGRHPVRALARWPPPRLALLRRAAVRDAAVPRAHPGDRGRARRDAGRARRAGSAADADDARAARGRRGHGRRERAPARGGRYLDRPRRLPHRRPGRAAVRARHRRRHPRLLAGGGRLRDRGPRPARRE